MIAVCGFCRGMITPSQAPVLSGPAPQLNTVDLLQQAALLHLAEFHRDEMAKCIAAGNLLTLFCATAFYTPSGEHASEWTAERDHQANGLYAILEADDADQQQQQQPAAEAAGAELAGSSDQEKGKDRNA